MSLDREYEKFKGGPTISPRERVYVAMDDNGIIFMNRNAHKVFGSPAAVYLYYNREKDTIALEPSNPRLSESFPVKQKQSGWTIHASPFCRHYGIKLTGTERFVHPDIDNQGILHLELRDTVNVSTKKGSRKKEK